MEDVLTWIGLAIAVVSLPLSIVALNRSLPGFERSAHYEVDHLPRYTFWHQGPHPIVVIRAALTSAGEIERPTGDEVLDENGVPFSHGGDDWAKGAVIRPHHRFTVELNTLQGVTIRYRAKGFFGCLSRATLEIAEGP